MNIADGNKKSFLVISSIRSVAFVIFCGISIAINLNMFLLLASTLLEKIVFTLVSVGVEGAKIYYVTSAPLYAKAGKKGKARLQYFLYGVGAFLAVIAAYGYIKTTIVTTDAVAVARSNVKEIANVEKDILLVDGQIQELVSRQKEDKATAKNDAQLIDEQIKMLLAEIKKGKPENMTEGNWNWQVTVKTREIENLKKQKTALLDKNSVSDKAVSDEIEAQRKKKDELVTKRGELEKKDADDLSEKKTDMFSAIGETFKLSGKVVMTLVLILIALMIEIGIISTVPDPSLKMSEENKDKDSKLPEPERKPEPASIPETPRKPRKPRERQPLDLIPDDPDPESIEEKAKSEPVQLIPVKPPAVKKEAPPPPFKPLYIPKPLAPEIPETPEEKKEPEPSTPSNIPTIVKKSPTIKKTDDGSIKKGLVAFLQGLYNNEESPGNLNDKKVAIDLSGMDPALANKFFDRIANIQGNRGKPLFTYHGVTGTWTANYPLSYLLNEILPKVRFNFHEEKRSRV
jgi:hypothetical protein